MRLTAGISALAAGLLAAALPARSEDLRGFARAITIQGGRGHVLEDLRVDSASSYGISLGGDYSTLRRCQVSDTGGSPSAPAVYAISVNGKDVQVVDNVVSRVFSAIPSGSFAAGILASQADTMLADNRVFDVSGAEANYGILCNGSATWLLRANVVSKAATPYAGGCTRLGNGNYP